MAKSEEISCDRCGAEALGQLAEEVLCETCYHAASACCGNFFRESENEVKTCVA